MDGDLRTRIWDVWKRTISLSWPIAIQQVLNTLMRTVDIIVTALFSPAAVAAVGLADLYAQFPLRVGISLGTGAIALSSQETGREATLSRDRAITQSLIIGFLLGIPLLVLGILLSDFFIEVLGAESEVVALGGAYLAIIFAASPMRIVALVGARSLQGTGDTFTPMVINAGANIVNIALTISLGLGLLGMPRLEIIGVGIATAVSRTLEAVAMTGAIAIDWTEPGLARPQGLTITKQLIMISTPTFAEGMTSSLARFPLNAMILLFGTEPNAAYHIGRRIYQQLGAPFYRSYSVASSVIAGQSLGAGMPQKARFEGLAITAFSLLTLGIASTVLFILAEPIARILTDDAATIEHAIVFTQVFAGAIVIFGVFSPIAGVLRGAGDTTTPFIGRLIGSVVFLLGFSYVVAIMLDVGLPGIYAGILLNYLCWMVVVTIGFFRGGWMAKAASLIDERKQAAEA